MVNDYIKLADSLR